MRKNVTVKINMKGVNKKIEEIAKKKYPPTYVSSEQNENKLPYSPPRIWYTPENSVFVPANQNTLYNQLQNDVPFGYHKIKCQHCGNVITVSMGYSLCPECKNTIFLN